METDWICLFIELTKGPSLGKNEFQSQPAFNNKGSIWQDPDTVHGNTMELNSTNSPFSPTKWNSVKSTKSPLYATVGYNFMPTSGVSTIYQGDIYERVVLDYLIPGLCVFGLVGNLLNIYILAKKISEGINNLEKGATFGLIALASSDFGFCFFTILSSFVPKSNMVFERKSLSYFMTVYGSYYIDTFIKTSTAFTVILTLGRYYAVCYPMKARHSMKWWYTVLGLILSVLFWFCFHIPLIWTVQTKIAKCHDAWTNVTQTFYIITPGEFSIDYKLARIMTFLWATIGFFIPVCILGYCNYKLVISLLASCRLHNYSVRWQSRGTHASSHNQQMALKVAEDHGNEAVTPKVEHVQVSEGFTTSVHQSCFRPIRCF